MRRSSYPSSDEESAHSLISRRRRFQKSYITSASSTRKSLSRRPEVPQEIDQDGCEMERRGKRKFFGLGEKKLNGGLVMRGNGLGGPTATCYNEEQARGGDVTEDDFEMN